MLKTEPGWTGAFTRETYPGSIPNGTRIVKIWMEPGDRHPIGAEGTILGSIGHPKLDNIAYFVEWDTLPRHAVAVIERKISPL